MRHLRGLPAGLLILFSGLILQLVGSFRPVHFTPKPFPRSAEWILFGEIFDQVLERMARTEDEGQSVANERQRVGLGRVFTERAFAVCPRQMILAISPAWIANLDFRVWTRRENRAANLYSAIQWMGQMEPSPGHQMVDETVEAYAQFAGDLKRKCPAADIKILAMLEPSRAETCLFSDKSFLWRLAPQIFLTSVVITPEVMTEALNRISIPVIFKNTHVEVGGLAPNARCSLRESSVDHILHSIPGSVDPTMETKPDDEQDSE
jgi:hypothetical protein